MLLTDKFSVFDFFSDGIKHSVYRLGDGSKPGVLIIQELPGIGKQTIALAERLHRDGFTVYLPHLFGQFNAPITPVRNLVKLCVNLEFRLLANRRRSPISDWLRALSRKISEECNGSIGAIGMCLTGGFVLTLMMDESVSAPVLSQPTHLGGFKESNQETLGVPQADLDAAISRSKRDDIEVLGLRFTGDKACTKSRFDKLESLFGDRFRRVEIDSSLFNEEKIQPFAHAVLTLDFKDQENHPTMTAYRNVVEFFNEKIGNQG